MDGGWQSVSVRCRSDYAYAQEPVQVRWPEGEWIEVTGLLWAARLPDGLAFRIAIGDVAYEVRYVEAEDVWQARRLH